MADIELVVKIPEGAYMHLRNGGSIGASLVTENAIKNGIPLDDVKTEIKDCLWKLSEGNTYLDITREGVVNAIFEIINKSERRDKG